MSRTLVGHRDYLSVFGHKHGEGIESDKKKKKKVTWSRPGGWLLPTCQDSLGCAKWAGWGGAQASLEQDNTKETVLLKLLLHLIFCYQKMLLREWSSGNSLTLSHSHILALARLPSEGI